MQCLPKNFPIVENQLSLQPAEFGNHKFIGSVCQLLLSLVFSMSLTTLNLGTEKTNGKILVGFLKNHKSIGTDKESKVISSVMWAFLILPKFMIDNRPAKLLNWFNI